MTKTSFHIGGFWFHVQWSADGTTGTDQHGCTWYNRDKPHTQKKHLETLCTVVHDTLCQLAAKNLKP